MLFVLSNARSMWRRIRMKGYPLMSICTPLFEWVNIAKHSRTDQYVAFFSVMYIVLSVYYLRRTTNRKLILRSTNVISVNTQRAPSAGRSYKRD